MSSSDKLTSLPTELLLKCIEAIADDQKRSLANLCLTAKLLRNAAEPYLYRRLHMKICQWKTKQLFRTVVQRPAVGDYIRYAAFERGDDDQPRHGEWCECTAQIDSVAELSKMAMRGALTKAEFLGDYDRWIEWFQTESLVALQALFLLHVPRLEEVELAFHALDDLNTAYLWLLLANLIMISELLHSFPCRGAGEASAFLGKLKVLSVREETDDDDNVIHTVRNFLTLPSLTTLCLRYFSKFQHPSETLPWDLLPASSSVRSIKLHQCNLDTRGIANIMESCRSLIDLAITYRPGPGLAPFDSFGLDGLRSGLLTHIATLETVHLRFDDGMRQLLAILNATLTFKLFSNLKSLKVS
ncbi:hypothetical protein LTS18_009983 [Coniosporium uncinatum]|uniref:Uncharacterized protein n=1 Tax=Coniosporium uncinatum TaxID=93489 RepID=A0ACC3DCK2_9PEZI|nr:hypothetical protein LTS18_009983 [Coniosporium uncinatum]